MKIFVKVGEYVQGFETNLNGIKELSKLFPNVLDMAFTSNTVNETVEKILEYLNGHNMEAWVEPSENVNQNPVINRLNKSSDLQKNPMNISVYHGSDTLPKGSKPDASEAAGVFVATKKGFAKEFGKHTHHFYIDNNKILDSRKPDHKKLIERSIPLTELGLPQAMGNSTDPKHLSLLKKIALKNGFIGAYQHEKDWGNKIGIEVYHPDHLMVPNSLQKTQEARVPWSNNELTTSFPDDLIHSNKVTDKIDHQVHNIGSGVTHSLVHVDPTGKRHVLAVMDVYQHADESHPYIAYSQVSPKFKGKGFGKALYLQALKHHGSLRSDTHTSPNANKAWEWLGKQPNVLVKMGTPGTEESHIASYNQLAKSEDLEKGSRQSKQKTKLLSSEDRNKVDYWQTGEKTKERGNVPAQTGTLRDRALHKLMSKAHTRLHPITKKPEILLHRGMSDKEYKSSVYPDMQMVNHNNITSWTPKFSEASRFADKYRGKVASAWVSADKIHSFLPAYGKVDEEGLGPNKYKGEQEVLVHPLHGSNLVNIDELDPKYTTESIKVGGTIHTYNIGKKQQPPIDTRINNRHEDFKTFGDDAMSTKVKGIVIKQAHPKKLGKSEDKSEDKSEVATVAVKNGDKLLMGKRSDNGKWTNPGGHLNKNEDPKEGALRELFEEAGIKPDDIKYLGSSPVITPKGDKKIIHCYLAEGNYKHTAKNDPDKEVKNWEWIDISKGLSEEIANNLHSPKNILLQKIGLQEKLNKSENLEKSSNIIKLYHGTPTKIANDIKNNGFKLTSGKRTGTFGSTKEVPNLGIFLSDRPEVAHFFGENRREYPDQYDMLHVNTDIGNNLNLNEKWPLSLKKLGVDLINKWSGKKNIARSDMWWLLDKPEFVNHIKELGYHSVKFPESKVLETKHKLPKSNTYMIFDPSRLQVHTSNTKLDKSEDLEKGLKNTPIKKYTPNDVIQHHQNNTTMKIQPHVSEIINSYPEWEVKSLHIDSFHPRSTVQDITDRYIKKDPSTRPALIAVPDSGKYNLLDGAHRLSAAKERGESHVNVLIPRHSDFQKSEDLQKGVARKIAPHNPPRGQTAESKFLNYWTTHEDSSVKNNLPRHEGAIRFRALNKLSARTKTRVNPETNEKEYLLHRGMGATEFDNGNPEKSSWTPKFNTAMTFGETYADDDSVNGRSHVVSAWIPESHMHNFPFMLGHDPKIKAYAGEYEVVVNPHKLQIHASGTPAEMRNHIKNKGKLTTIAQSLPLEEKRQIVRKKVDGNLGKSLEKGLKGDWQKEGYTLHVIPSMPLGTPKAKFDPKQHGFVVQVKDKDGKYAGSASIEHKGGNIIPYGIGIRPEHRRKGLASGIYKHSQELSGKKIVPEYVAEGTEPSGQSEDAKALWSQPNRPFGKSLEKAIDPNKSKSVVKDEKGNLKPVYHGTLKTFPSFQNKFITKTQLNYGPGHYFAEDPSDASEYAKYDTVMDPIIRPDLKPEDVVPNVHKVFLNIKNPFNIHNYHDAKKVAAAFGHDYDPKMELANTPEHPYDKENYNPYEINHYDSLVSELNHYGHIKGSWQKVSSAINKKMQELGYDGIANNEAKHWVAFNGNQVSHPHVKATHKRMYKALQKTEGKSEVNPNHFKHILHKIKEIVANENDKLEKWVPKGKMWVPEHSDPEGDPNPGDPARVKGTSKVLGNIPVNTYSPQIKQQHENELLGYVNSVANSDKSDNYKQSVKKLYTKLMDHPDKHITPTLNEKNGSHEMRLRHLMWGLKGNEGYNITEHPSGGLIISADRHAKNAEATVNHKWHYDPYFNSLKFLK